MRSLVDLLDLRPRVATWNSRYAPLQLSRAEDPSHPPRPIPNACDGKRQCYIGLHNGGYTGSLTN